MQEIILENLAKWFSNLDFSLNKQDDKFSLICKELNIKVENLSREEFISAVTEQGITGVEKLFNLKALGIDLRELFGIQKQPKPSAKPKQTEKTPKEVTEDWIRSEVQKAFLNGEMNKSKSRKIEDLFEQWKDLIQPYTPLRPFEIICSW